MDLSPEQKADIAFLALQGNQSLEAIAQSHHVDLWQVIDWGIALRQKGHQVFSTPGAATSPSHGSSGGLPWRTVFIHIPKTAGTTLATYLEDAYAMDRICSVRLHNQLEDLALKRNLAGYDLLCGHFFYGWFLENANFTTDTRYVTVLREPLKRAVSMYHHWMREPARTYRYVSPLISDANAQCMFLSPLSTRAAHYSMRDHLEAAKQALSNFFFVGIQERFGESLELLHQTLGITAPDEPRIRNVAGRPSLPQLPAQLLDEIVAANWADLELYAFACALFEQRLQQTRQTPVSPIWSLRDLPLPAAIRFAVSDPLQGSNWHEREGVDQPRPWRWSGPGTQSTLRFKLDADRGALYRVTIYVINAMSADILASMQVFINGVPLEFRQARDGDDRFYLEGEIEGMDIASKSGDLEVRLIVAATLSHFDIDPSIDDKRPCGFALSEFLMVPV